MNKASEEKNYEKSDGYFNIFLNQDDSIKDLEEKMNRLQQTLDEDIEEELEEESEEEPVKKSITYEKDQMNEYLDNKADVEILKSYKLKLPSNYKDKSMEEFQKAFDKGMEAKKKLKKKLKCCNL